MKSKHHPYRVGDIQRKGAVVLFRDNVGINKFDIQKGWEFTTHLEIEVAGRWNQIEVRRTEIGHPTVDDLNIGDEFVFIQRSIGQNIWTPAGETFVEKDNDGHVLVHNEDGELMSVAPDTPVFVVRLEWEMERREIL